MQLKVRVTATELPASAPLGADGSHGQAELHLGVQRGEEPEQLVAATNGDVTFDLNFTVARAHDGKPNFTGPYAKGTRDERFFYLIWLLVDATGSHSRYGRAKVHLSHLGWDAVEATAVSGRPVHVSLRLTDAKGRPQCGSVRAVAQQWSI